MIPVQVRFTKKLIELIDELVEKGVYSNRSEAIRDATRKLVMTANSANSAENGSETAMQRQLQSQLNKQMQKVGRRGF